MSRLRIALAPGDGAGTAVGAAEYTTRVAADPGRSPTGREPTPVPDADRPTLMRPAHPRASTLLRTFETTRRVHIGCDIYTQTLPNQQELAPKLGALAARPPFELTVMSNRGTQVWPSGWVYTEVADYRRARFEPRNMPTAGSIGQRAIIILLRKVSEKSRWRATARSGGTTGSGGTAWRRGVGVLSRGMAAR
jgi:isocitrate dehydrogenase